MPVLITFKNRKGIRFIRKYLTVYSAAKSVKVLKRLGVKVESMKRYGSEKKQFSWGVSSMLSARDEDFAEYKRTESDFF